MARVQTHPQLQRRNLIILGIFLVVLYVLLPQFGAFKHSLHSLRDARPAWIALAVVAVAAMYSASAGMYVALARSRLRYGRTLLVEMASLFASRLLPAGIGPIGINYAYLRKNKHTQLQAGSVVAVNNLLGFIGNMLLLGLALMLYHSPLQHSSRIFNKRDLVIVLLVLFLGLAVLVLRSSLRHKVMGLVRSAVRNVRLYKTHPLRVLLALSCTMALTACHTFCLYACAHAVGVHLSVVQALLALTVEVAGATVTPTPGGLGGAEASLVAALVAFGFAGSAGLAVALLFRLLTYWLALIVGGTAFVAAERLRYL